MQCVSLILVRRHRLAGIGSTRRLIDALADLAVAHDYEHVSESAASVAA